MWQRHWAGWRTSPWIAPLASDCVLLTDRSGP
jgi:hypothetical protein